MARRRRRRGTWFPNLGTLGPNSDPDDDDPGVWLQLSVGGETAAESSVSAVVPLTFDEAKEDEELEADTSLADFLGSEYIIDRILGTVFASRQCFSQAAIIPGILLGAGLFVARQEDSTHAAAVEGALPIGTETASELRENYSPITNSTIREPWMWRRKWILGNQGIASNNDTNAVALAQNLENYPATTAGYLGVNTGPYVDVKSKRHVRGDERLYFIVTARNIVNNFIAPFTTAIATATTVLIHFDYRIYGRLVKAQSRSSF